MGIGSHWLVLGALARVRSSGYRGAVGIGSHWLVLGALARVRSSGYRVTLASVRGTG